MTAVSVALPAGLKLTEPENSPPSTTSPVEARTAKASTKSFCPELPMLFTQSGVPSEPSFAKKISRLLPAGAVSEFGTAGKAPSFAATSYSVATYTLPAASSARLTSG